MGGQQSQQTGWNVRNVILTIRSTPGHEMLVDKIPDLMLVLDTDPLQTITILRNNNTSNLYVTLGQILTEWKNRNPEGATIDELANALISCGLQNVANAIRDERGPQQQEQHQNIESDRSSSSMVFGIILLRLREYFRNFGPVEAVQSLESHPLRALGEDNNEDGGSNGQVVTTNASCATNKRIYCYVGGGILVAAILIPLVVVVLLYCRGYFDTGYKIPPSVPPDIRWTDRPSVGDGKVILPANDGIKTEGRTETPSTPKVSPSTEIIILPAIEQLPIVNITAESYHDYQIQAAKIGTDAKFNVYISSKNFASWQTSTGLYNNGQITRLSIDGLLSLESLLNIVNQTVSVSEMSLNNSRGELCSSEQPLKNIMPKCYAYLPVLKNLTISNFTNCKNLLEAVAICLHMGNLEIFKFSGVINSQNVIQLQNIIKNAYRSLQAINLVGSVETQIEFFEFGSGVDLRHVESILLIIIIDMKAGNKEYKSISVIGNKFYRTMKGLKKFELHFGLIDPAQFHNLLRCRELVNITVSIKVKNNSDNKILEGIFKFRYHLPFLKTLSLEIHFNSCAQTSLIGFLKEDESKTWLDDVTNWEICTFCLDGDQDNPECFSNSNYFY